MGDIQLLDCTVRDGGYNNDWEFGRDHLVSIFERLVDSGVDIIEIGFLDDRRPLDYNRSIMPGTQAVGEIWGIVEKRPPMVVGMIDYGTCALKNIQPCKDTFLDGIRVIFKKQKMHGAMEFCAELKSLGYKVFSQLVSITAYSDDDLRELAGLANEVGPYAVSMVDTYGLLMPRSLLHYAEILDGNIKKGVLLGFHAHNNLQMAYANAVAFLERRTDRNILVDGTLYGMGKSAGNAPLELLAKYMNDFYGKNYSIRPMLEAIEESILPVYEKTPWGYKKFFYMSAAQGCHPNYLNYFQKKGSLSQSYLDELLLRIRPEEKKLLYDESFAEKIYQAFIAEKFNDKRTFTEIGKRLAGRNILLIGPGRNICLQIDKVKRYMAEEDPVTISVNFIPDSIPVDFVFVTKVGRYEEMTVPLHEHKNIQVIATSNVTEKNGKFAYTVVREPLLEQKEQFTDNSFLMLLKVLKRSGIKQAVCAGFDGYSNKDDNYAVPAMEYDFVKGAAQFLNRHIQYVLNHDLEDLDIQFITYSHYCDVEDINSAIY